MNNEMSSLGTQKAEGPFVLLTLVGEGLSSTSGMKSSELMEDQSRLG